MVYFKEYLPAGIFSTNRASPGRGPIALPKTS